MLVDYRRDSAAYETHQLHDERMAIMRGIAYQAAMAAENARLLEARQEEAYVSAALLQVAQAVVSLNDLDEILESIVRITPMLVGVEQCAVFLWNAEENVFTPGEGYGTRMAVGGFPPEAFPLLDTVRRQGERVTLADVEDFEGLIPASLVKGQDDSDPGAASVNVPGVVLGVPLSVKGDALGVLLVGEEGEQSRFNERRLEIITGIAQQAALAVQNDRLQQEMAERERLEQELELAREIQQTFMPEHLPSLPGWELAVTWRAARQVAGDFYDVFELPGRRLGVVIADVADKGMPAALFMALTRTLMRAAAGEGRSPGDALGRVNELLVPDARHGMFVTGLYAILSLESGEAVVANAGHHPPLILRSGDGHLEQMERGETALGVLTDVDFQEHAVTLGHGDCMILFTDGVTEALSADGVLFGEPRLHEVIRKRCTQDTADGTLSRIVDAVADFVGDQPASDDLTLMVVRRQAD
jgi:serine phosphatase RsbU (regulator of sigma subunit)